MNKWTKALQDALSGQYDKPPKGWVSRSDLQKIWGLSKTNTRKKLLLLKSLGKIETVCYKRHYGRAVTTVPYYRLRT